MTQLFTKSTPPDDDFGRAPLADALVTMILEHHKGLLPLVVGIFGAWGTGKTRFLEMMRDNPRMSPSAQENDGTSTTGAVKAIWFDPWVYERRQDVASGLIYRLLREVEASRPSLGERATAIGKNVSKLMAFSALKSTDVFIPFGLGAAASEALRQWLDEEPAYQSQMDDTIEEIRSLIAEWAGTGRVVVFVDDLDRCMLDQMIRLLESLQIIMAKVPCVFVLGVDRIALEAAVRARYGEGTVDGRDYIDKIVDLGFPLPPLTEENLTAKYSALLGKLGLANSQQQAVLTLGLQGIPRLYERLANHYTVLASLPRINLLDEHEHVRTVHLVLSILKIRFPQLYDRACNQPKNFATFVSLLRGGGGGAAFADMEVRLRDSGAGAFIPFSTSAHPARTFLTALPEAIIDHVIGDDPRLERCLQLAAMSG